MQNFDLTAEKEKRHEKLKLNKKQKNKKLKIKLNIRSSFETVNLLQILI